MMLRVIAGDALEKLRELPDESVQCCVTSPPYWGLRDYSANGQLGLEKTPEEYVAKMVEVFREVRRVLRRDGTLWLNLGDSYNAAREGGHAGGTNGVSKPENAPQRSGVNAPGLKPKDLCGIPWRVAFALQADGWWLRSDIIWAKPNPMPESVTDRPTKAHEYLFLLTKASSYYYDAEAIKEQGAGRLDFGDMNIGARLDSGAPWMNGTKAETGRNKRSVWTVATAPYPEAHFATYPPDLIKPCIMAGTSAKGCCAKCGAPWERVMERGELVGNDRGGNYKGREADVDLAMQNRFASKNEFRPGMSYENKMLGWQPTCTCHGRFEEVECEVERAKGSVPDGWMQAKGGHDTVKHSKRGRSNEVTDLSATITQRQRIYVLTSESKTIPCTVLDPFAGSGTTGAVALELGRKAVLIELNPKYVALIEQRCNVTMGLALA